MTNMIWWTWSFPPRTRMSFFNLTYMGYDNTISESLEQKQSPATTTGSHVEFTAMKTKHTRSEKGKNAQSATAHVRLKKLLGVPRSLITWFFNMCSILQDPLTCTVTLSLPPMTTDGTRRTAQRFLTGPRQADMLMLTVRWQGECLSADCTLMLTCGR